MRSLRAAAVQMVSSHRSRNQYCYHKAPCPRGGRTRGGLGVAARVLAADGQKRYGQAGICRAFGRWTRWQNLPHPFSDGLKRNGKGMRRGVVWRYGSVAKPKRWQGDEHDAGCMTATATESGFTTKCTFSAFPVWVNATPKPIRYWQETMCRS